MSDNTLCPDFNTFQTQYPTLKNLLITINAEIQKTGLDKRLLELLKIRVSQINGCSYCLDLHQTISRNLNINWQKILLVSVWREADIFDEKEKIILEIAEQLTKMADYHHKSLTAQQITTLKLFFTEEQIVNLVVSIGLINLWNRVAGGLGFKIDKIAGE